MCYRSTGPVEAGQASCLVRSVARGRLGGRGTACALPPRHVVTPVPAPPPHTHTHAHTHTHTSDLPDANEGASLRLRPRGPRPAGGAFGGSAAAASSLGGKDGNDDTAEDDAEEEEDEEDLHAALAAALFAADGDEEEEAEAAESGAGGRRRGGARRAAPEAARALRALRARLQVRVGYAMRAHARRGVLLVPRDALGRGGMG